MSITQQKILLKYQLYFS